MANKKKKNQKTKKNQTPKAISPEQYIVEAARKVPIYECWYNPFYEQHGMTQVIVARIKESGNILVGAYLIDILGLGLKDTFFKHSLDIIEYETIIEKLGGNISLVKGDPNFIFNLIYGAIEYAEDIGLEPDKGFEITQYILPPADEIEFMDIEFGKNGKPFLDLTPLNANKIIKKVEATIGAGNFDYTINRVSDNNFGYFNDSLDYEDDEDFDDEDFDNEEFTDYEDITPQK